MQHIKMLGLAALALAAVGTLVGVSSASAKVCSTEGTGEACASGHGSVYTSTFHATLKTGTKMVITSGFINFACTESTMHGTIPGGASSPSTGRIDALTVGGCTDNISGRNCTVSASATEAAPWPGRVTTGTSPNGLMTLANITMETTCEPFGSPVTCRWTASDAGSKGEIVVKGADTTPEVIATSVPLVKEEVSNGLCSNTATLSGTYVVTTPKSLFLT